MAARSMAAVSPDLISCSALARQRDDVVPDDADADVVKVVVREVGDVPLCASIKAWHLLQRPLVLKSSQPRLAASSMAFLSPAMK